MKEIKRIGQVTLYQGGPDNFAVQYGLEWKGSLNYDDAAHRFGECLFHQLACEHNEDSSVRLDNRTPREVRHDTAAQVHQERTPPSPLTT